MDNFEYKSFREQKRMTLEELNTYYRNLRKYEYETNQDISIEQIEHRKKWYQYLRMGLIINRILANRKVTIIGDRSTQTSKPKIYACTHIARYDIETAEETIRKSAWFIMGDPGETYRNLDGRILRLLGVSFMEMNNPFDAHTVNVRQTKILGNGGNELVFPEQAWHLDPIYLVGDLHPGVAKRAIRTNAVVIPIGIEQYKKGNRDHYYANIGENLDFNDMKINDAIQATSMIKEQMKLLKWEIFEQYGQAKRTEFPNNWDDALLNFIESIMHNTENGYTIEEIIRTRYNGEQYKIEHAYDVFSYLSKINLNSDNAFLAHSVHNHYDPILLKKIREKRDIEKNK